MSGPKVVEAHFHTLSFVLASKRKIRAFEAKGFLEERSRGAFGGKREDPLGGNTQRKISLREIGSWP